MQIKRGLSPHITSIPGLNPHPNSRNILKNVRFLIAKSRNLRNRTDLVLWRDTFDNTTTKNRSKNFRHCDTDNLVEFLQQNSFRFEAIVYCTRKGARDIVKNLLKTVILVIKVTKLIFFQTA